MNEIFAWIESILFCEVSYETLHVVRRLLGILIIWECIIWIKEYPQLLSPSGWYSKKYFQDDQENIRFSLLRYLGGWRELDKILLGLGIVGGLMLLAEIIPVLACMICFIVLISIQNRNIFALNGGDQVRRMLCLLLLFLPKHNGPAWPLIFVQLFIANIYFKAFYHKLWGEKWRNGTASMDALAVKVMTRFELPDYLQKKGFHKLLTYGTLFIEGTLFTLIWIDEIRVFVVIGGMLMHLGMGIILKLTLFQTTMIVLLITFL